MEAKVETQELILEKEEGVATLTLNRPRRYNAMTRKMLREDMPRLFNDIRRDRSIKALIITGAGEAFCSGADVGELEQTLGQEDTQLDRINSSRELMLGFVREIKRIRRPIIGAINGMCAGGGFSLALLCDLRLASERARFTMAFVRRGLIPDLGATYALPRLVGPARAMEICLLGDVFDANTAERLGIVNRVVLHQELMPAAKELARRLASGPSIALELIKEGIYHGIGASVEEAADFEGQAQAICRSTEDFKEGVRSFLEKREPQFKGR